MRPYPNLILLNETHIRSKPDQELERDEIRFFF